MSQMHPANLIWDSKINLLVFQHPAVFLRKEIVCKLARDIVSKLARATEEIQRKSGVICSCITQSASVTSCSLNGAPVSLSNISQELLFTGGGRTGNKWVPPCH